MIIAVDKVIPYWEVAFSRLGDLRPFSGRHIRRDEISDADALVVRSTTPVSARLLEGSRVRFVGTASTGMDHLDEGYLRERGIRYTNAAGSNAVSVAEYVIAVLLHVAECRDWNLSEKSIAIVGVGKVGSQVEKMTRSLGMEVLLCDPPLRETTGDERYEFLGDVLEADIISLHVPLTRSGRYPTHRMVNREILARLSPRQFLINTARGPVVHEAELKTALKAGKLDGAVLDVWEEEPEIDYGLLELLELGTPHIAGFSLDGKVRGTEMILIELCDFLDLPVPWETRSIFPPTNAIRPEQGARGQGAVRSIVRQAYDVSQDDANLRALAGTPKKKAAQCFDSLRDHYRFRPEFRHFIVELPEHERELACVLSGLGFQTSDAASASINGVIPKARPN